MSAWLIWLIAAAALATGEVLTMGFFLGPVALAAALAAVVAAVGAGPELQVATFAIASVASVLVLRPIASRHLRTPAHLRTGTAALVGASAVVTERVHRDGGQVRLAGEIWSARPYDEHSTLAEGARVEVMEIRGATALVAE